MKAIGEPTPVFGHYRLPRLFVSVRRWIAGQPPTRPLRLLASALRRLLLSGGGDTFDIEIFPGVRARIHPRSNRCEKAVLTGTQFWDAQERAALGDAIRQSASHLPFVFVDVGANVGFYSLFACSAARACGRSIGVLAIEPDRENLSRLQTNIALNGFDEINVLAAGVGEAAGRGSMAGGERNRGERHLVANAAGEVRVVGLAEALGSAGLAAVDCMKVDIEGHDLAALSAFFATAPAESWPKMLIVEIGRDGEQPMSDLWVQNGYALQTRTKLNAIFRRS
jgi:FkbM family methyltransferase